MGLLNKRKSKSVNKNSGRQKDDRVKSQPKKGEIVYVNRRKSEALRRKTRAR